MPNRLLSAEDWEGFGIVFLEAALAGTPAVGGNNGGVPDAVADGTTGLLVDPEVPGELTGALRRLLLDPELRRRMGEAGRRRAAESFSWRAIADRARAEIDGLA
jgi:phosphatidylinositol alpha-1,6-mannosyltransferase